MLGAMFTWWFLSTTGVPFIPALILGVCRGVGAGCPHRRLFLRTVGWGRSRCLVMSTGLGLVIQTSTLLIGGSDLKRYAFPLQGHALGGPHQPLHGAADDHRPGLSACIVFYLLLQRTKLGPIDFARSAQDHDAATLQGINRANIRTILRCWLGTGVAAMCGALADPLFGVEPFMGQSSPCCSLS